ncbi:MAG: tRNA lysidine(34) synthetase TilS [Thermosynechococcaceae cyanobacterium]
MGWTALHAAIHQTLRQRRLLGPGQAIVLGFSGGQDSLCLLQILRDLQPKWQWRLAIAHCDHRWPPDSAANAVHVSRLAQAWQLEHYGFVAPQVLKSEAAGRTWRYQVLTDLAEAEGFSAVLTAHTASDRAETLLYNLLRGSGMEGLQALAWTRSLSPQVQLVRPLLNTTREQTGVFCAQHQLPLWHDAMNLDKTYRRNRLRLDLLPLLREHFNPQVEVALARTAEILQAETAYLDQEAQHIQALATIPTSQLPSTVIAALDQARLQQTPLALQRRILRRWLQLHLGHSPTFEQIEKTVRLITGHQGDRTDPFKADLIAEVHRPWICLRRLTP